MSYKNYLKKRFKSPLSVEISRNDKVTGHMDGTDFMKSQNVPSSSTRFLSDVIRQFNNNNIRSGDKTRATQVLGKKKVGEKSSYV